MYGEHFNRHTYGIIEQTADHFHWDTNELWHDIRKDGKTIMTKTTDEAGGGHAHCGMTILQGQPFPEALQSSVLALNLHGRRINRDTLHRHGTTYTARHAPDFMKVADPWFRGVEIINGRAGELFIADWSDTGECHENDGIHRTSGRIYRLAVEGDSKAEPPDVKPADQLNNQQLAELVASEWEWLSRKCLLELAQRAAKSATDPEIHQYLLAKFHSDESEQKRLRRLWALHVTGGANSEMLAGCLDDKSEHVRCWAVRFLSEEANLSPSVLAKFQSMAQSDDSGLVLTWLASGLQRLRYEDRWPIALALGSHKEYAHDRVLPLMVWYGVEPAVTANPDQAIDMVVSQNLLGDRDMSRDAINGLAAFGHDETPKLLVAKFGGFNLTAKQAAITTLVSRPKFASVLLDAVSEGKIDRTLVSAFQLRQMQNSGDASLSKRVAGIWPELAQQSKEKTAQIAELREKLTPETLAKADLSAGRLLFSQSCAICHKLYGDGKEIAPDLTGAQRNNLNYLLENIVDPSATVSENFKLSIVLLEDGRVINGVIVGRTEKTLTLQTATDQIVIQRDEIDEMKESPVSMMPDKLLDVLSGQQIQNLIAYLMSSTQVPIANAP